MTEVPITSYMMQHAAKQKKNNEIYTHKRALSVWYVITPKRKGQTYRSIYILDQGHLRTVIGI